MKKLLIVLIALISMQTAFADDAAKIKIKISGAMGNNRYFLCMPNVGCLSMLAAQRGKVFPIFRPIDMNTFFVADVNNNFHLTPQRLPSSCNGTVKTNQTITISGNITANGEKSEINGLHCSIS